MPRKASSRRLRNTAALCVYCGTHPRETDDHVPPRAFFPDPRPPDLITVPACWPCNRGASKDEQFFLASFMWGPAGESEVGKRLWVRLQRMYDRSPGIRRGFAERLKRVELTTASGLFLGRRMTLRMKPEDECRYEAVVEKIARGLYYHEYGVALPAGIDVDCYSVRNDTSRGVARALNADLRPGSRGWNGIFRYRHARTIEDPTRSAWLFLFYEQYVFMALTGPAMPDSADEGSGSDVA